MKLYYDLQPRDYRPKTACDRCGLIDATVKIRKECSICGPTPLCDDCHEAHSEDRNKI